MVWKSPRKKSPRKKRKMSISSPFKKSVKKCNFKKKQVTYNNCVNGKFDCELIKNSLFKSIVHKHVDVQKYQQKIARENGCRILKTYSDISMEAYI